MSTADGWARSGPATPTAGREPVELHGRGRRVAFESTANLDNDGATNRRVYLYENKTDSLLRLSRSRFGENRVPRISNGRFVVWESTADLTGGNPEHKRVIYLFDRRKDE